MVRSLINSYVKQGLSSLQSLDQASLPESQQSGSRQLVQITFLSSHLHEPLRTRLQCGSHYYIRHYKNTLNNCNLKEEIFLGGEGVRNQTQNFCPCWGGTLPWNYIPGHRKVFFSSHFMEVSAHSLLAPGVEDKKLFIAGQAESSKLSSFFPLCSIQAATLLLGASHIQGALDQ